ncbi:MAG: M36 family metallopeptidase [Candidatus Omnitrophica bacterium]|nr:M36 family metallopeptidase [Candidatus Omnitrophota bacterium]
MKGLSKNSLVFSVLTGLFLISASPTANGQLDRLPDYDRRLAQPMARPTLDATREAAAVRLRARIPGLRIELDSVLASPRFVYSRCGLLTPAPWVSGQFWGGDTNQLEIGQPATAPKAGAVTESATNQVAGRDETIACIKRFLDENAALFGYGSEALESARITKNHVIPGTGMRTMVWQQELDAIPIFEASLYGHMTRKGELVNLCSQFVPNPAQAADAVVSNRMIVESQPPVRPEEAVATAAVAIGETATVEKIEAVGPSDPSGTTLRQCFTGSMLKDGAEAQLLWLPLNRQTMSLCWKVMLVGKTRGELFEVLVDAQTGEFELRRCWTFHQQSSSYRVFANSSPLPWFYDIYPSRRYRGLSVPGTNQPPDMADHKLVEVVPEDDWINQGETRTIGNNIDAHLDWEGTLPQYNATASRPSNANLVFDYSWDSNQSPMYGNNTNAAVVNAFFWANWMHDRLYELGFTETAHNFQMDNYGRGDEDSVDGDPICVDVQWEANKTSRNGSDMLVEPQDGPPTSEVLKGYAHMRLGIWDGPDPDRDAAMEAETILHEYTHALVARLAGSVNMTLNEGWANFYPMALLSQADESPGEVYPMCAYTTRNWARSPNDPLTNNYYFGITLYPHSLDMSKNPLTFVDINFVQWDGHPGIPRNPEYPDPLNYLYVGQPLWTVTLWEARANLIEKHGFSEGNQRILQLVTDAMGLGLPVTFLDYRSWTVGGEPRREPYRQVGERERD